jgi:hypothetical protein
VLFSDLHLDIGPPCLSCIARGTSNGLADCCCLTGTFEAGPRRQEKAARDVRTGRQGEECRICATAAHVCMPILQSRNAHRAGMHGTWLGVSPPDEVRLCPILAGLLLLTAPLIGSIFFAPIPRRASETPRVAPDALRGLRRKSFWHSICAKNRSVSSRHRRSSLDN